MSNYFIYYGVTFRKQLIISCYHSNDTALVGFRRLDKSKNTARILQRGVLPQNRTSIKGIILNELTAIQLSLKCNEPFTEIHFTGDINLGFGGHSIFPEFLLDTSLSELFKSHSWTEKALVFIYLESNNGDIVEEAMKIYLKNYEKLYLDKYPDSQISIQVKHDACPLYHTPPRSTPSERKNTSCKSNPQILLIKSLTAENDPINSSPIVKESSSPKTSPKIHQKIHMQEMGDLQTNSQTSSNLIQISNTLNCISLTDDHQEQAVDSFEPQDKFSEPKISTPPPNNNHHNFFSKNFVEDDLDNATKTSVASSSSQIV